MDARYQAIPSHYATDVVAVLEKIRAMRDSQSNQSVLVGAITDGNSDPRNVPELAQFFDFCVNAEQVRVSKPDKRVYLKATEIVHANLQDCDTTDLENWVGPWWIHVGDDFSKDIVAAKNLNIRTVWAREWISAKKLNSSKQKETAPSNDNNTPSSEQELIEFQKKINSQPFVTMAIGSDDYLVASIQQEFADAIIDNFGDLTRVLREWQDQSEAAQLTRSDSQEATRRTSSPKVVVQTTAVTPPSAAGGVELALESTQPPNDDEPSSASTVEQRYHSLPFTAHLVARNSQ
jgi:FMN phosphatase YigB (HAD superfamily)